MQVRADVVSVFSPGEQSLSSVDGDQLRAFEEFQAHMSSPGLGADGATSPVSPLVSLLQTVDGSRIRMQEALAATAAHPTRENMVVSMRRLSELDLSATLAGKIADKGTKALDRILNLQ